MQKAASIHHEYAIEKWKHFLMELNEIHCLVYSARATNSQANRKRKDKIKQFVYGSFQDGERNIQTAKIGKK